MGLDSYVGGNQNNQTIKTIKTIKTYNLYPNVVVVVASCRHRHCLLSSSSLSVVVAIIMYTVTRHHHRCQLSPYSPCCHVRSCMYTPPHTIRPLFIYRQPHESTSHRMPHLWILFVLIVRPPETRVLPLDRSLAACGPSFS